MVSPSGLWEGQRIESTTNEGNVINMKIYIYILEKKKD
jgi:hypothetical protein